MPPTNVTVMLVALRVSGSPWIRGYYGPEARVRCTDDGRPNSASDVLAPHGSMTWREENLLACLVIAEHRIVKRS
jgi:hypothetical protein